MLEGLKRIDAETAADMAQDEHFLDVVSWTFDFYGKHRDIALDLDDIEAVLKKTQASAEDREIATSWKRRMIRSIYRAADHLPFLIPRVANADVELQLRDLRRYAKNDDGIAERIRQEVKLRLRAAASANRPILLYGHSMGSVIAYDALWQLTHEPGDDARIDMFLTTGSPLGQRLIQKRLKGAGRIGTDRYPGNIHRWANIAAIGELTAIDMTLKNDFREMTVLGLVEDIEDLLTYNYYTMQGTLNVHTEYGYLVNEVTASVIRNWWKQVT